MIMNILTVEAPTLKYIWLKLINLFRERDRKKNKRNIIKQIKYMWNNKKCKIIILFAVNWTSFEWSLMLKMTSNSFCSLSLFFVLFSNYNLLKQSHTSMQMCAYDSLWMFIFSWCTGAPHALNDFYIYSFNFASLLIRTVTIKPTNKIASHLSRLMGIKNES